MTAALRDSARIEDILRGSDVHPESGGRIILFQYGEERANVTLLDNFLNTCKALRSKNASKWEVAIQEEYNSLMNNGT